MRDADGRAVLLRGVNFPSGLRLPEAARLPPQAGIEEQAQTVAGLGFNVARLQVTWGAIEPGNKPSNDPGVCSPGKAQDPGQWDEAHAQAYLDRVEHVVDALADAGVYSLFQISQYGYNDQFGGPPSHPDWAVCTDGLPITEGIGPTVYAQPAMANAADHFWRNDVKGDLQGEYVRMLRAFAQRFRGDPAVAGFELYNEPFSRSAPFPDGRFDGQVQCFYMGSRDPGRLSDGSRPACDQGVPEIGAIPAIRAIDPDRVLHPQAHIFTNFGVPTRMGPLPADNLVFNFHVYCLTGIGQQVPDQLRGPECETTERAAVEEAQRVRHAMASERQPGALGWFLSEFAFTNHQDTIKHLTEMADEHLLGWAYFTWRNDDGPDNSGVLREHDGTLRPKVRLLARPYPTFTSGTPTALHYDPAGRKLRFSYRPDPDRPRGKTVVVLPNVAYRESGACPSVRGATWAIYGDRLVLIAQRDADQVDVTVTPGRCGRRSGPCISRRTVRITLPRWARRRGRVTLDGRPVAVRRSARRAWARIDLRGRPAGAHRVRITAPEGGDRARTLTRIFTTCRPRSASGRG